MALTRRVEHEQDSTGLEFAEPNEGRVFDPSRHLIRLPRGGEYLEVKWRLLWLRNEFPHAQIETEMVHFDPEKRMAVFKARITIPDGGSATGWGSESSDDFKDFIEKAETKALGRACAALGFGTQHSLDFDYDNQGTKVVDAPVNYPSSNGNGNGSSYNRSSSPSPASTSPSFAATANPSANGEAPATERQIKFIYDAGKSQGMTDEQVLVRCKEKFGVTPEKLSKSNASRFIDMLKQPV